MDIEAPRAAKSAESGQFIIIENDEILPATTLYVEDEKFYKGENLCIGLLVNLAYCA